MDTILRSLTSNGFGVEASSRDGLPPTPLTSLLEKAADPSSVSGSVLSGYDDEYSDPYLRTRHDNVTRLGSYASVAAAATLAARAALADAVADEMGVEAAVSWAASVVGDIGEDDEEFKAVADCLFVSGGSCELVREAVAEANAKSVEATGYGLYSRSFPSPPSYFVSVYDMYNSQPYVVVNGKVYGRYEDVEEFEKGRGGEGEGKGKNTNFVGVQPSELETAVKGMLQKYFNGTDGFVEYHPATDESLEAQRKMGLWEVSEGDSELWTEPNWNDLGFAIFNDAGEEGGADLAMKIVGTTAGLASLAAAWIVGLRWRKQKLL